VVHHLSLGLEIEDLKGKWEMEWEGRDFGGVMSRLLRGCLYIIINAFPAAKISKG
jgi:hypothetical protein